MRNNTSQAETTQTRRTLKALLMYLILALYTYQMNIPGPVISYLRQQFQMNYTMASLHFSAFAAGMVIVGLFGKTILTRLAPWKTVGLGCLGMGFGGLALSFGQNPFITVFGLFLMGLVGTLILSIYPAVITEEMGAKARIGLAEANSLSSMLATLAPLAVGFSAARFLTWRPAVYIASGLALGIGLWLMLKAEKSPARVESVAKSQKAEKLPLRFWGYWFAQVLAVAIEFCIIYWSAEYFNKALNLEQTRATQSVSLFMLGMVIGRFVGGRLIGKLSRSKLLIGIIGIGIFGFALFWLPRQIGLALIGVFLLGLGISMLYPTILSYELEVAGDQKTLAGSHSTLASGLAVLILPFVLASLADLTDIHSAFGLIPILYALLSLMLFTNRARKLPR